LKTYEKNIWFLLTFISLAVAQHLPAQGTAFTYQGQLQNNGGPASGAYDFTFALFTTNDPATAQAVGGTLTNLDVGVTNGLFTTTLDFGPVFTGNAAWLAVGVRTNGGGGFNPLTPWQALTPTPYALYAPSAGAAASASLVAGSNIVGTLAAAQLPAGVLTNGAGSVNLTGVFTGDGTGLSNVTATALAPNNPGAATYQTNTYSTNSYPVNGTYTITVPPWGGQMVVKLWGAGGGYGADFANDKTSGGGGAFSQATLNVTPGETFALVVGQSGLDGAGLGENDGSGGVGASGYFGGSGAGGQASSLFQFTGSVYIMKAVAGGGGGGGIDYGGQAGQANGSGAGYATNATTTGLASLNLMGGDGTPGSTEIQASGGGGGGYGGGSGGNEGSQAGGGGSFGDITISGTNGVPGNSGDPNYLAGSAGAGQDGLGVVIFSPPPPFFAFSMPVQAPFFVGDGSQLTNLAAARLTGTVSWSSLPNSLVTNNATGVTLSGTFTGNGSGLTSLPATAALRTGGNTFSGNQIITNGSVGIGTTTPGTHAMLEVDGTRTGINALNYEYLYPGQVGVIQGTDPITTSIYAAGSIVGLEVFAFSDARIKNISGVFDSARDLATLMGIQITDYTYKDTVARGSRPQKKVIAQQVEQVYPQAVNRTTDVVPDIYRKAKIQDGWVYLDTDLKVGERVKLMGAQDAGVYEVLAVRPGAFRTAFRPVTDEVFVYGREVKDFHTVDYDAIAMLNVSATQELNRRVQAQAAELRVGEDKIAALAEANQNLEHELEEQKEQAGRLQAEFDQLQKVLAGLNRTGGANLTLNQGANAP
jgi:hypothetical protein